MNRNRFFSSLAFVIGCSSAVHAQSSVTLYGTLDTSIDYISNQKGGSNWAINSGNLSTDRWGLRGAEDLGGGMKAIFDVENGFNIGTGKIANGGDLFGRQSWVGLSDARWGTVTLGRQYDAMVDLVEPLSATGSGFGGNIADHPFDNDNLANDARMNNAVKYRSNSIDGVTFEGAYAFSNMAGHPGDNNAWTVGAAWTGGPLSLAIAYLQVGQPGGENAPTNTDGAFSSADGDAMLTGERQRTFGAAAHYAMGAGSVGVVYTRTVLNDPDSVQQGGSYVSLSGDLLTFNNYEINAHYAITPAFSVGGSYVYTDGYFSDGGHTASPHWNQFMLQADYALSRRTDLYLEGVYQHVSGADGIAALDDASVFTLAASGDGTQTVVAGGIRHRF